METHLRKVVGNDSFGLTFIRVDILSYVVASVGVQNQDVIRVIPVSSLVLRLMDQMEDSTTKVSLKVEIIGIEFARAAI